MKSTLCRASETARDSLFHKQHLCHSAFSRRVGATLRVGVCHCAFVCLPYLLDIFRNCIPIDILLARM